MKKQTKGFTLIELLVVIAIIGILLSIVLASLNTARAKSSDAAIKGDFSGIRPQAVIYYDNNGSYGTDVPTTDCFTTGSLFVDPVVATAISNAQIQSGAVPATCIADDGSATVGIRASAWAVSMPLKADPTHSWCVDSNGFGNIGVATMTADTPSCQ
jgi:prepilin-type N-terminal cleavage/methylation domain-containing protein